MITKRTGTYSESYTLESYIYEITDEDDDATTDFIGTETAPIVVLHHRDLDAIRDDAPTDAPTGPGGER